MVLDLLKSARPPAGEPSAPRRQGSRAHRAGGAVSWVLALSPRRVAKPVPPRRLYLYSRHHIDLLRVAGALCRP